MENVWKPSAAPPLPPLSSSYNPQNPPVTLSSSFPSPEFPCTFYPHATLTTSHYEDTPHDVSLSLPGERLSQQPRSHHLTKSQRRQSHRKRANRCSSSSSSSSSAKCCSTTGGGSDLGGRTGISCYSGGGQGTASHNFICDNENDGINFDDSEEKQLKHQGRQKLPPLLNDILKDEVDISSHNKVSVPNRNFQNDVVRGTYHHSTIIQKSSNSIVCHENSNSHSSLVCHDNSSTSSIVCRHKNNSSANQRSSDSEKNTISNFSHNRDFTISPKCIGGCNGSSRSGSIITKSRRLSNFVKSSTSRSTSSRSESLSPCSSSSNNSNSNSRISGKAGSTCNNITTSNVRSTSLSPSSSSYCHHVCPSAPATAAAAPVPLSIPQRLIPRLRRCSPVLSSSHIHQSHNHHVDSPLRIFQNQNTSSSSPPRGTWLASCVEDRKRKRSRKSSTEVSNPKANPLTYQHEQQVEVHHPQGIEKQNAPKQNEEQEKDTEAGELKEEEEEEADASSSSLSLSDFSESSPNTPSSPLWTPSAARRRLRTSTVHRFRSEGKQRNSKTFNTTVHQLPAVNKTTAGCLSSSERRSIRRKSVHHRTRESVVSHSNDKNKKSSRSLNSNSQNKSNIIITSNSSCCAASNSSRQTRFPSASSQHRRCAPLTRHWRPALLESSPKGNFPEESQFIESNLLFNQSIPTSEIHPNQQTQQLLLEDEDGGDKNGEGDGEDEEDEMSKVSPSLLPPSLPFSSSSLQSPSCLPCLSTSCIATTAIENPFASAEECRSHRVGKRSFDKQTESRGESLFSLGSAIPLDETSEPLNSSSSSSSHSRNNSQRKSFRRRRSSSGSHKNCDPHCSLKTKRSNEDEYVRRMNHSTSTDRIRAISATTVATASTSTTTSTPTASTRAKTRCSDRTISGEISSFSTPSTVSSQQLSSCQSPSYSSYRRYELQINSSSSSFSSSSMSSSCSFSASASSGQTPSKNGREPSVSSRLVSAVKEKLKTEKEDNKEVYQQDDEENSTDLSSTTSITLASLGVLPEYSKPSISSSSSCLLTAAAESLLESSPSSFLESPASASTAASPPHDSSHLYYPYEGAAAKKERNLSIASSVDYISFSVSPRQSESPPRNSSRSSSSFPTHLSSPAIEQQNSCKTCYQCLSHPALFDTTAVNTSNLQDSPPNQMGFPTMASLPSTPPSGVGSISSHCCPRSSFRNPKRSHSETLRDKGNGMEDVALPFSSSSESSQTERQEDSPASLSFSNASSAVSPSLSGHFPSLELTAGQQQWLEIHPWMGFALSVSVTRMHDMSQTSYRLPPFVYTIGDQSLTNVRQMEKEQKSGEGRREGESGDVGWREICIDREI